MAFHASSFLAPLFAASLLHSSALTIYIHIPDKVVDAICDESMNPELCKATLRNLTLTSKGADIHELGVTTGLLAASQARSNRNLVGDFLQNEKDDVTEKNLADCLSDYTVTWDKLRSAHLLSDQKVYKGMIKLVNAAMEMTKNCENRFQKLPSCPSPLKDNYQKMVWLNDIALVAFYLLDR